MRNFAKRDGTRRCNPKLLTLMLLAAAVLPALSQAQTVNICDRTPQVRDEILLELEADDCAAVTAEQLAGIEGLCFNARDPFPHCRSSYDRDRIAALKPGDFDGLASLERLDLINNQLRALPDGAFDGLASLQELRLDDNQLATLPDGVFDGLTSLQRLLLRSNYFGDWPDGAFDGLTSLQLLDLSNNDIESLPDGAFDGLTSLQVLHLNGASIESLPDGAFDGLTSLRELDLQNNQLRALPDGAFDGLTSLFALFLNGNQLATIEAGAFDGLTSLVWLFLDSNQLAALPAGVFDGLTSLQKLDLHSNQLAALPAGVFDGLTSLRELHLQYNRLAALPAGVFDGLTSLQQLHLLGNRLAALPAGVFDGLTSLQQLHLLDNRLAALPAGVFDGLTSLQQLYLLGNRLTALPDGVFDGLTSLRELHLQYNRLATLPDGAFDGLTSLRILSLWRNQLTALPAGAFDGLTSLQLLDLSNNDIESLPDGVFDGLTSLQGLGLTRNRLASLPDGVFNGLTSLETLVLNHNYLARLNEDDLRSTIPHPNPNVVWEPQFFPPHLRAAVPLFLSATDSMRQGFVRIINESNQAGSVRILAFDDAGNAANPVEIQLGANQSIHFNAGDLENGNANKGINEGVGSPMQGDWRLGVETELGVRVLSYMRTNDGFLTEMNYARGGSTRDFGAQLQTINPGSNQERQGKLRLINFGVSEEPYIFLGFDDASGDNADGFFALTLAAGQSRTLSAQDLENGASGLIGTLGDGAGKWRLGAFNRTDEPESNRNMANVFIMGLVENHSVSQLSNLTTEAPPSGINFFPSASDNLRQGFVRISNLTSGNALVRILAFDDAGNAANPVEIQLGANQSIHFNAGDLENGNANKGINEGVGSPMQGDWRLKLELVDSKEISQIVASSFVRTNDGFLAAIHDVLQKDNQGRLAAYTFLAPNGNGMVSKLRVSNTGGSEETVSIEGVDDQGASAGPVSLTLAAGQSRTLSAQDLENGASGLTGTLGDGAGDWRLFITAGESVVGMNLLENPSGHLSNISDAGFPIN